MASTSELRARLTALEMDSSGPHETLVKRLGLHAKTTGAGERKPHKRRRKHQPARPPPPQPEPLGDLVEIVPEELQLPPNLGEFSEIFQRFQERTLRRQPQEDLPSIPQQKEQSDSSSSSDDDYEHKVASRKKQRKLARLTVAALKSKVAKPDLVEWTDVTSIDPEFLIFLKSYRNLVPVPVHWCTKRKFLQGKRGAEKMLFELPDFIKDTGIMALRDPAHTHRNKYAAKMGKLDIDYQKLHDAFFKYQTKPYCSSHGEMYTN